MNITEVNIFPRNTDSLLAIAHIIIDGVFIVKSIKIIDKYNETLANPQSRAERNNNETQEDE